MTEKTIHLTEAEPQDFYGAGNKYLTLLKGFYPKLKVTARGHKIKVNGDEDTIAIFEEKVALIQEHLARFNSISENQIERIVMENGKEVVQKLQKNDDVLVHGVSGHHVKARTINQKKMVELADKNDLVFAIGPAGTGKTYTGVALAVRALKNKEVKRIILTRPAVEAGENLGFLPGDMKEKLDPYMRPLYDALRDMIPFERLNYLLETQVIEIAPLAFMRGRTLDNAFVILDEAQNTTLSQMKMFLTRMGASAKFIVTGDQSQIDLPRKQRSGLSEALRILKPVKGIGMVFLDDKDVVRHQLVKDIIKAYSKVEEAEYKADREEKNAK